MRPFAETVATGVGHALRSFGMLLLFAQLYVLLEAFRRKRSAVFRVFACVQTAAGLLFFSALLDGTFRESYLPFARSYPSFVTALYDAPWLSTALILLALSLVCAGSLICNRVYKKTHIFHDAIKQTVDLLPEGVCFGDGDGTAVFFNMKMDEWCRALTGTPLKSAKRLHERVSQLVELQGERRIVRSPDGTALLFSFREVEVDGRYYSQITASDMTRQYRITDELRENHARLTEIRERMREFSSKAAELAMSHELLKARMTVHDEVGHVLLRIKYYLDHPETTDVSKLITLIRTMNGLLLSDAQDDVPDREVPAGSPLDAAVTTAKELGVRVELHGAVPEDGAFRAILSRAIRECSVNTVKHAGGTVLRVGLFETAQEFSAVITNDGTPPSGTISETGGLASLRIMVERAGGIMEIESVPSFLLTIRKPV